jgi:hypothetical protein
MVVVDEMVLVCYHTNHRLSYNWIYVEGHDMLRDGRRDRQVERKD